MADSDCEELDLTALSPYVLLAVVCDGLIYLPVLDDYAVGLVNGAMIRQLAARQGVRLSDRSLRYLALGELTRGEGALEALLHHFTSPWAYLKRKLDILSAGEEAARSLGTGVLFHRYAGFHRRKSVPFAEARRLKQLMDHAIRKAAAKFPVSLVQGLKDVPPGTFRNIPRTLAREARRLQRGGKAAEAGYFDRVDRMLSSSAEPFREASRQVARLLEKEARAYCRCAVDVFDAVIRKSPPWAPRRPAAQAPAALPETPPAVFPAVLPENAVSSPGPKPPAPPSGGRRRP